RDRSSVSRPSAPASRGRRRSSGGEATPVAVREQVWPVTLRDMRREDLMAVLEIERRSFAQPWSRAFFEKELATPFARLVVAVEGGRPGPAVVGYTCRWRVTDEVHVLNVAVHPERRGRGFGRLLLEAIVGEARSSRARGLSLAAARGKPRPRLVESPGGMLNAIGLQNIGVEAFLRDRLPALNAAGARVVANFWGDSAEEFAACAARLDGAPGIVALELNA